MALHTPRVAQRTNVLVVGGAGFFGSHLCEFLLETHNVICVDTYVSGREENIDHLFANPHFEFIRHDIREPLDFKSFKGLERFRVAHVGVQHIYHLANTFSPALVLARPIDTALTCVQGTKHILELALQWRSRLLFVSDAGIYGADISEGAVKENVTGIMPWRERMWWYGQHLRSAESLIEAYRHTYSLDTKIVRLYHAYGPHMYFDDGRFIPTLIRAALANEEIVIDKDFLHASCLFVSDAVDGLEKVMNSEKGSVYNLGHPTAYSVDEIVQKVISLTNSASHVRRDSSTGDQGLIQKSWKLSAHTPDMALLRDEAGWFPIVLLEEGLKKTIDFMKSLRGIRHM